MDHEHLIQLAANVMRQDGFGYVLVNPDPGRFGEHPDALGACTAQIGAPVDSPWYHNGEPVMIRAGETQVGEIKTDRADFLKDQKKWHRDLEPKYGNYFVFYCPPTDEKGRKVITKDDLAFWQGLCYIDADTGTWEWVKAPVRRAIDDRVHEFLLAMKVASGELYAERVQSMIDERGGVAPDAHVLGRIGPAGRRKANTKKAYDPIYDLVKYGERCSPAEAKSILKSAKRADKLVDVLLREDDRFGVEPDGGIRFIVAKQPLKVAAGGMA